MTSTADKNRSAAYSRASVRRKLIETVGSATITFDLDEDGKHVYELEHPFFRSPEQKAELEPLDDSDEAGIAKVVLGDKYDDFIKAGGRHDDITQLFVAVSLSMRDSLSGRPTRS